MRKFILILLVLLLASVTWAQSTPANDDTAQMRQEIEQLKKTLSELEQRMAAQEKAAQDKAAQEKTAATPAPAEPQQQADVQDLKATVKDIDDRLTQAERKGFLDRVNWGGDYRFEGHSIRASVPNFYDGMKLQNLMVRTFFLIAPTSQGGLGMAFDPAMLQMPPTQFAATVNGAVQQNYSQYQYFTNNLRYSDLQAMLGQFSPQMQQSFMQYLMQVPGVYTQGYKANTNILYTNRLRLNFDAKVADNIKFVGRLSMYKVFGDSTGVQVFNGQATSLNIDGTTARVPNSDILRVERAFFSWNNIADSKFYLSIGRRPSTDGPPVNLRQDEPRGGTPMASLIDYQFDGITFGYRASDTTELRLCYGVGFSSGFGNGDMLHPADNVKDVHLLGANIDIYNTDTTLIQTTVARAWNVTDGFTGLTVMNVNPLTGDQIPANFIMRYQPSANLGNIDLYGLLLQHSFGPVDAFVSGNWNTLRPNGVTTPFGGLGSDPFQTPTIHNGHMIYAGLRYNVPQNNGKTKLGFEFNQGSKYWFNFAQAQDDIIAPKTSTRGEVYETYLTHRIHEHFIFKLDYMRYNYTYSGSGWHLQTPKRLDSTPLLGFPTFDTANMLSFGLTARF